MMIGALEVVTTAIKAIARAEQGVLAVLMRAAVCVRAADSKAEREEKILESMNRSLSRYVCLNLVNVLANRTTNARKQFKRPVNVICSCSTCNLVFMTPHPRLVHSLNSFDYGESKFSSSPLVPTSHTHLYTQ